MRMTNRIYSNKKLEINDIVFSNYRYSKSNTLRTGKGAIIEVNETSIKILNPYTSKKESYKISTFLKRYFYNEEKKFWEFERKFRMPNFDYI